MNSSTTTSVRLLAQNLLLHLLIWRQNVKSSRMRRSATDGVTTEADLAQCDASRLPPPFLFLWLLVQLFFTAPLSNLPSSSIPSQTEVCSTMGESIRPSSFHNPTLSANKHVVKICPSSLPAAVQTVQVSVEPRLSTALKDRSVVPSHGHKD